MTVQPEPFLAVSAGFLQITKTLFWSPDVTGSSGELYPLLDDDVTCLSGELYTLLGGVDRGDGEGLGQAQVPGDCVGPLQQGVLRQVVDHREPKRGIQFGKTSHSGS